MERTEFDTWYADGYDTLFPHVLDPAILDRAVDFLADLARDASALELGVGTGRLAIPLTARGVAVHGIEESAAMVDAMRAKPGGDAVSVTVGDFCTARVDGPFHVAYLVRNTITNVTTQAEQVQVFRNVAAHLEPGGAFVIENYIPHLRKLPPGETMHVFDRTPEHLGIEEYAFADQIAVSHHYWMVDGTMIARAGTHRYVWPAELDLMAELAGLSLRERWGDWERNPFTDDSESHVSVWTK
jgi:SAM-dependent methyltransferase